MSYTIFTDTSANLPSEQLAELEIGVLPFAYFVGDEAHTCLDTAAFDGAAFYGSIRAGARVTTSQVTPQQYIDHFEPVLQAGGDLLYVGMSSGISGSFASAQVAAQQLREKYPARRLALVDTLRASLGEGLLVLRAAQMRREGARLDEITARLWQLRTRMCQVFTVDDLMYLRKSGRVSGAAAIVGTMLKIKPLLKGNEKGQIVTCGKVRGRRAAIAALAARYDELVQNAPEQTVGIAHADCPEDAGALADMLRRRYPPGEILSVCYEPVTGSHVGPGTLALFFMGDEHVRER